MSRMEPADIKARLEVLKGTGVPVSAADEKRVADSVKASLEALDRAVKGTMFDTEPQTFDVVMRRLAKGGAR